MDQPMEVERMGEDAATAGGVPEPLPQDALEALVFDKSSRRSSLGADSLFDQEEGGEDGGAGEYEGGPPGLNALDSLLCGEYADDIFALKRVTESHCHPTSCMAEQPQVTEHMRCTLVHWLVKVNEQLQFAPDTVFVAVGLMDRFLASTPLAHDCFQLMAVTALFLAAKMEESALPGISELVAICGGAYKPHHFRRMEVLMLSKLDFWLSMPTSWYFIDHLFLKAAQEGTADRRVLSVSRYVCETCLSNYRVSQFLPSVQAAAAVLLALTLLPCPPLAATIAGLLAELYRPEEVAAAHSCSGLMTAHMAPFLESLSARAGPQPSPLPSHQPRPPAHDAATIDLCATPGPPQDLQQSGCCPTSPHHGFDDAI